MGIMMAVQYHSNDALHKCVCMGQFTCPKGHLSETYRHRVRVSVGVRVKFGNLHNSILDK